jgi:hypothetical protein
MMIHTESWLILSHKEITPTVRVLIDGWAKVYTRHTNGDGIRINFHHESKTMDAWRAVEGAWGLDEEPSEDDEESNAQAQPADQTAPHSPHHVAGSADATC